jgi:hypothetical protein
MLIGRESACKRLWYQPVGGNWHKLFAIEAQQGCGIARYGLSYNIQQPIVTVFGCE